MSDYHFPDPVDVDQPFHLALSPWIEVVFDGVRRLDCAAVSASGGWIEVSVADAGRGFFIRQRLLGSVEIGLSEEAPEQVKAWLRLPVGHPDRSEFDAKAPPGSPAPDQDDEVKAALACALAATQESTDQHRAAEILIWLRGHGWDVVPVEVRS